MSTLKLKEENDINLMEEMVEESGDQIVDELDFSINCEDIALIEDKSFIIDLVNKNDHRLTFVSKIGKSQVWNRYQKIYYKNLETNFVKCMYCNDIKKHNKYLGTATMLRHHCFKNSDFPEQTKDLNFDLRNNESNDDLDESTQEFYNNKQFLQSLMDSNDERLSFEPQNGKSEVWSRFERVLFQNKETLYVSCKSCHDLHKQTRFLGTTTLLRHRCQNRRPVLKRFGQKPKRFDHSINLRHVLLKKKCQTNDEKIRVENKTLKTIIKKCLEVIDKCLCINRTILSEKKRINVLINGYNEWLAENQDFETSSDISEDFDDFFEDENTLDEESIAKPRSDEDLDEDPDYDPSKEKKDLKPTQRIVTKSSLVLASDLVKRKYVKSKVKSLFHCDYAECGRSFNNSYNLMQHRNKHNPTKYRCDWPGCDEKFQKKVQYEIHMSSHTNEKNFKCDFEGCHYETCHSLRLKRHKKFHSSEKPYKCDWPGCDFATSHKNGLRHHKYRHSGEKPYKCSWPSCEWSFRQSTHLRAHMLKHTGERPYGCEVDGCQRSFTSRQAMRFHAEKVHNVVIPLK